jgi:hypothetical protein
LCSAVALQLMIDETTDVRWASRERESASRLPSPGYWVKVIDLVVVVFLENWVPAPTTRLPSPPAPGDGGESPTFLGILE